MTTTVRTKASQIYRDWLVVDAANQPLGRLASEVAKLLIGKHKPFYEPHLDCGDYVIVVNAAKVRLSGRKTEQMVFYRHSGYPGGLKARSWDEQMKRDPAWIIERTVWGMLPKGALGESMIKHLKVYAGPDHPHESQVTGSERAREAREKAQAEALAQAIASPKPLPRLRPLPVPQQPVAEVVPEVQGEAAPVARAPRTRQKAEEARVEPEAAATPPAAETIEAEEKPKRPRARKKAQAPEAAVTAPETTGEAEAVQEKPKRTRARKKAEPEAAVAAEVAPGDGEETAKPKRTRARKKSTEEAPAAADEQGEE